MDRCRGYAASAVFLVIGLVAGPALAGGTDTQGWYAGAAVGSSDFKDDSLGGGGDDAAYRAYAGYRLTPYLAIEAGYADLGGFHEPAPDYGADIPSYDTKAKRSELAVLGILPLGLRAEAYASIGLARTQSDQRSTGGIAGENHSSQSGTDTIYGAGVRFNFNTSWSARLQYDHVSDATFFKTDIDTTWLGVEYHFRG